MTEKWEDLEVAKLVTSAWQILKLEQDLLLIFSPYEGQETNKKEEAVISKSISYFAVNPITLF